MRKRRSADPPHLLHEAIGFVIERVGRRYEGRQRIYTLRRSFLSVYGRWVNMKGKAMGIANYVLYSTCSFMLTTT